MEVGVLFVVVGGSYGSQKREESADLKKKTGWRLDAGLINFNYGSVNCQLDLYN